MTIKKRIRKCGSQGLGALRRMKPVNLLDGYRASKKGDNKKIVAHWYRGSTRTGTHRNWGDAINPTLITFLSGKEVVHWQDIFVGKTTPVYQVIGSTIGRSHPKNTIIWGAGIIGRDASISVSPKQVLAVRGPLTRDFLIRAGIPCPEIYGDPAMLLPSFYSPAKKSKRFRLGIIPHYVDQNCEWVKSFRFHPEVKIIDILQPGCEFIDDLHECEAIISSSLHGIIAADAYGIPARWVEFSKRVIGDGFKFHDYFLSVGRSLDAPMLPIEGMTVDQIIEQVPEIELSIDVEPLLASCPFRNEGE